MSVYYRDDAATLLVGDARQVLAGLPAGSADCVVTSPPYFGLRDYQQPGQYGLEATPAQYVANLRAVFREVRRVLAADGTCWLNLGDCYSGGTRTTYDTTGGKTGGRRLPAARPVGGLPAKNLLGIPWRVAFALQADGWILRNAVVWHKTNARPASVRDRLACRYELIFLLVKQDRYWFDLDPIREPPQNPQAPAHGAARCAGQRQARRHPPARPGNRSGNGKYESIAAACRGQRHGAAILPTGRRHTAAHPRGRNPGDVWPLPTRPFRAAHFAVFPAGIPLRAIAAGCRPGGTVLDPFCGTGTTGVAVRQLRRSFTGIELSREFAAIAAQRLAQAAGNGRGRR